MLAVDHDMGCERTAAESNHFVADLQICNRGPDLGHASREFESSVGPANPSSSISSGRIESAHMTSRKFKPVATTSTSSSFARGATRLIGLQLSRSRPPSGLFSRRLVGPCAELRGEVHVLGRGVSQRLNALTADPEIGFCRIREDDGGKQGRGGRRIGGNFEAPKVDHWKFVREGSNEAKTAPATVRSVEGTVTNSFVFAWPIPITRSRNARQWAVTRAAPSPSTSPASQMSVFARSSFGGTFVSKSRQTRRAPRSR